MDGRLGSAFAGVLAAARRGDAWAFEALFVSLGPAVLGYCRAQGAPEPDDLASEVFLRAFTRLGSFSTDRASDDEHALRSWVFTIAHHQVVDDRRLRARRPNIAAARVPERPAADASAEGGALRALGDERVAELLAGLAPDQRDVLLLRIVADLTVDQVARALDKRPGAVKALQRRGLAALRRQIERAGVPL